MGKGRYQDEAHALNASWHYEQPASAYFGFDEGADRRIGFRRMMILTNLSPDSAVRLFGPRDQTFTDSDGRRLSCWRLEHLGHVVWLFAHNGRGSSLEIHRDATPEECLEIFKWIEQQVEEAGLVPPSAELAND